MLKFSTLFAPAALALATAGGSVVAPAPAAAQDNSGPNCIRDDFGFCADLSQSAQQQEVRRASAYDTMISQCGGRQWADRWGQQLDRRIRGSLAGSVFEPTGSPYGRFRAQQEAACRAGEQMYRLSVQYDGWENVPPDMQRSAERAWFMATQLGPQRDLERRFNQTWRNQQERWADSLSRRLGF